jgi:alkanesulfonate monooxygenase SsuD/methylene tetrahydromethanopterin reductase-like flavin-dependent oxidoreductase (luciferase family)
MSERTWPALDRRQSNPIFGTRRLKLGSFQTNLDSACIMSDLEGRHHATWPNTVACAKLADEMEFEAIVPVARWRGFGGKVNPQGAGFETYTWAAGLGAMTRHSCVFATSHVPMYHPIVSAKQSAAIDHITNGRFCLNIVAGWNKPEIDMFGTELLPHDQRFEVAEEWLTIIKRLWTEDEDFDFEGRYFKIHKGQLAPKPLQKPYPPIMNAGGSERGRHFCAKHCDVAYVAFPQYSFEECKKHVDAYRTLARTEYKRELQVWALAYIVQGETEKEALDFYDYYVNQKGDWEAAQNVIDTIGLNAKTFAPERLAKMQSNFIAGWSGIPLIGTKEQVVDKMATLSKAGVDGLMISWPRYEEGMRNFKTTTLPLLKQAGLR